MHYINLIGSAVTLILLANFMLDIVEAKKLKLDMFLGKILVIALLFLILLRS